MAEPTRWVEGQPDPDQVEIDNFIDAEAAAAHERDEQAIVEGEERYYNSIMADEIGIGYANPDYLDSSEDFEGDNDL